MTPTTVRMVLVEGDKADGPIVDHDVFDVTAADGTATSSNAAEQVVEAVLGTRESAAAGGHHLKSIGVTWSDHAEASTLRDTLAARGIEGVMLVSDGHAAGALAQAVGLPVSAPDEPELALARGAALASANAPAFEATTVGLAYSQDPDGTTAGNAYVGLAAAETQLAPVGAGLVDEYAAPTDMEPIPT